jgi:putative transposase
MHYRRAKAAGGTYFFTVNLADRSSDLLVRNIDDLRTALNTVRVGIHLQFSRWWYYPNICHTIWRLPSGDADYPLRWSLLKAGFSRRLGKVESIRASRQAKRERGIWQRRFWEHQIRDEADLSRHVDYIHYNPVKHGWVARAAEWPHSTLHKYIERGMASADWGGCEVKAETGGFGKR